MEISVEGPIVERPNDQAGNIAGKSNTLKKKGGFNGLYSNTCIVDKEFVYV